MNSGRAFILKERTILKEKIKESLGSVMPVTLIVLVLCFTIAPVSSGTLLAFMAGAVLLVIGMGFFTLGAEMSMTPMGEYVGAKMTKSRKILLIVVISFFVGVMITISEPDLQVLAEQVPNVANMTLILSVAIGVGIFLVIAMLRIIFGIKLSHLLILFYLIVFGLVILLCAFASPDFIAVSFDSGGVTTGPMTVPFIMALGVGVASIRSDSNAESDSFGLVSLSSVGPIIAVLILGLIYKPTGANVENFTDIDVRDSADLGRLFAEHLPDYIKEVAVAVAPIVIFFFLFQALTGRMVAKRLARIGVGCVYTYVGLVLFLTGVNVGFMPAGSLIGRLLGNLSYSWIIIPIGMLIGYFIVDAEPAVHVLTKQVEEVTAGAVSGKSLSRTLGIGVSISVGLAMLRVLTGISILWILVPGYLLALVLTFFVPDIFTSIAFDSGGVASGPMTATFLLAFAMGACEAVGGNIVTDAFGVVAMVAMTPLIAIQIFGLIYNRKLAKMKSTEEYTEVGTESIINTNTAPVSETSEEDDIIEL